MDCAPCLRKQCERDEECGRSIGVEQVLDAVRRLLSQKP
jgi:heptosyltransferase-1